MDGSRILRETDGDKTLTYYYGNSGVIGFRYNNTDYYYRKNLQGDIIAIYNASGLLMAEYHYDAWGRVLQVSNKTSAKIGNINPFRYRGYYYDTETGMYYLETRYYDPETGRFINADSLRYLGDGAELSNYNLFAYCGDNPGLYNKGSVSFDGSKKGSTAFSNNYRGITRSDNSGITSIVTGDGNGRLNWFNTNGVVMTHHTVFVIKDPLVSWVFGNISYTTTVQLNSSEPFYWFYNTGNDGDSVGIGMNLGNWYGRSVYVSSDIGWGSSWQLTPWVTGSSGWSAENGISISLGVIKEDTTDEITVSVGNGALLGYAFCTALALTPIPAARAVAAGAACLIFIVDLIS